MHKIGFMQCICILRIGHDMAKVMGIDLECGQVQLVLKPRFNNAIQQKNLLQNLKIPQSLSESIVDIYIPVIKFYVTLIVFVITWL